MYGKPEGSFANQHFNEALSTGDASLVPQTDATLFQSLGYFGNIFVHQHTYDKAGKVHQGHTHNFDHVTILAKGSMLAEVAGGQAKVFKAPTFIVIKKELWHKFTALEDGTTFYCVFALRDLNGDVSDIYTGDNSPFDTNYGGGPHLTAQEVQERLGIVTEYTCPGCTGCKPGGPGCAS